MFSWMPIIPILHASSGSVELNQKIYNSSYNHSCQLGTRLESRFGPNLTRDLIHKSFDTYARIQPFHLMNGNIKLEMHRRCSIP